MPRGRNFVQQIYARAESLRPGSQPESSGRSCIERRSRVPPTGRIGQGSPGEVMSPTEQEIDSLESLEERIQEAVQLVSRLRRERDAALEQLGQSRAESARLADEVKTLQAERKQVRSRIEKLLGQIDQLGAG